ncbi:unnamed protein product [Nesidiocoris tenuis]|uniref:Uncharacterized protein n=1 Tax=Nesidiocoris tenuis TaxID=355587 RepID=A0A6H5GTI6_9HEMI|nr:unnamed protein product [Nesidiocoris tenuis]
MRRSSRILLRNNSVSSRTRQRSARTNKKTRPTPFRNKTSRKNSTNSSADVKPDDLKRKKTINKPEKKTVKRQPITALKTLNGSAQGAKIEKPDAKSSGGSILKGSETCSETIGQEIENTGSTGCNDEKIEKRLDPDIHELNDDESTKLIITAGTNSKIERALKNLSPQKSLLVNDGKTTRSGRQFSPYDFGSYNLFRSFDSDQSTSKSAPSSSPAHNPPEKPSKRKRGKNIDNWPSLKRKFRETECDTRETEASRTDPNDFLSTENKENSPPEKDLFADEDVAFLIGEPPTFSRPEGHRLPPDFFNLTCPNDFNLEVTWPLDCEYKDVYAYKRTTARETDNCDNTYPKLRDVGTFSIKRYMDGSEMKTLSKISLSDTRMYEFQSVFKDVHAQIAHFENKTGHLMGAGDGRKFDILETEKDEKKRLYRKKITDTNLIAWHEYIVASSTKYMPDDNVPSPKPVIRLPWMTCPRGDLIWRLNNTRPLPTVDDFFRGLTNCRKRKF